MFTQPTPILSLGSDLQSRSLSSQPPPAPAGEQTSLSGCECWSAPIFSAGISLLCPLHPCCCTLRGSEASPQPPPSLPVKGLPSVWKLFFLHSSSPRCRSRPHSFVSVFSFLFCPAQVRGGVSCLLGSLRSSASVQ